MTEMEKISEPLWKIRADWDSEGWASLRDDVIHGGHASIAYFQWRAMKPLGELPFSLAVGDHRRNLDMLLEGPQPQEDMAAQIWILGTAGYPTNQLLKLLRLLADVPWSTLTTKQAMRLARCLHASTLTIT